MGRLGWMDRYLGIDRLIGMVGYTERERWGLQMGEWWREMLSDGEKK